MRHRLKAFAIAIAAYGIVCVDANAHTHVDAGGVVTWYPKECCNDRDCQPVKHITFKPEGYWVTAADGHTVLVDYNHPRRPSEDGRWHICLVPNGFDDLELRCVFEPPQC